MLQYTVLRVLEYTSLLVQMCVQNVLYLLDDGTEVPVFTDIPATLQYTVLRVLVNIRDFCLLIVQIYVYKLACYRMDIIGIPALLQFKDLSTCVTVCENRTYFTCFMMTQRYQCVFTVIPAMLQYTVPRVLVNIQGDFAYYSYKHAWSRLDIIGVPALPQFKDLSTCVTVWNRDLPSAHLNTLCYILSITCELCTDSSQYWWNVLMWHYYDIVLKKFLFKC